MTQPEKAITGQAPVDAPHFTQRFPLALRRESVMADLGDPIISDPDSLFIDGEKLKGRTALVTGASSGLGRATAELFGSYGMNVILVGRDRDRTALTQKSVEEKGGVGYVMIGDMKDPDAARRVVEQGAERFGKIDVGVLNAGIIADADVLDMTPNQWYDVAHGNGDMTFFPAQALARQMVSQENSQESNLVFVSSVSMVGNPGQANYSYSKAGIEAVAKSFARSSDLKGISVGILTPGGIDTEMIHNLEEKQQRMFKIMMKGMMPSKRAFSAEEMAKGVGYLATLPRDAAGGGHRLVLA